MFPPVVSLFMSRVTMAHDDASCVASTVAERELTLSTVLCGEASIDVEPYCVAFAHVILLRSL
jgi:hypothetical protein